MIDERGPVREDVDNSDELYEGWRDDQVDNLHDRIALLYIEFVRSKDYMYYYGNPEKFKRHIISFIDSLISDDECAKAKKDEENKRIMQP